MTLSRVSTTVALVLLAAAVRPSAQDGVKESDRITAAITVLDEVTGASDAAMPRAILERAEAIAVFPSLVKAGFVVGGSRGHGVISVRDPKSGAWSSPAFLTITGGSIGFQIGVQEVDLVLVVQNRTERAYDDEGCGRFLPLDLERIWRFLPPNDLSSGFG